MAKKKDLRGGGFRKRKQNGKASKQSVPDKLFKSTTQEAESTKTTLLTLPSEIRNKTWSYTFTYYDYVNCGKRIDITCLRPFPKLPVAASVCRQMLAEVLGTFLNGVDFWIWIDGCEGEREVPAKTAYMRFCKLQRTIGGAESAPVKLADAANAPKINLSGGPEFEKVVLWARDVHASDLDLRYGFATGGNGQEWLKHLDDMLNTAVRMQGKPWKEVRKALKKKRTAIGKTEEEWLLSSFDIMMMRAMGQW